MEKTFRFDKVPSGVNDIKVSTDPFETVAQVVAVLCNYKNDVASTIEMLKVLKGPAGVSEFEKQFLHDRLGGKEYKPYSFFDGATPENNYTPTMPLSITVTDNPYSYQEENYANLFVRSSGADSERSIKLRKKPSTGEWFMIDNFILSDIRIPTEQDPWA